MGRKIDKIILHCSDSDIDSHSDISVIDSWHKTRGFRCRLESGEVIHVGYHYFIGKDGNTQTGRPLNKMGAHCKGQNKNSIGICLHGATKFGDLQFKSLRNLIIEILVKYPNCTIHGHNEFSSKTCPVFDVDDFLEDYLASIDAIDVNG